MGMYRDLVLPMLCHLSMRNRRLAPYRQRTIGEAAGRVLEIGCGSGLNLPYYRAAANELFAIEPAPRLISMARRSVQTSSVPVTFVQGSAESIPFDSQSFDTVVTTWTLCTIPHVSAALNEMRRVLRPSGRLLFVEHGRAPNERLQRWQDRLTPAWRVVSGGCHLNRKIDTLIGNAGFKIERLTFGYMPGPKVLTFMYEGSARL